MARRLVLTIVSLVTLAIGVAPQAVTAPAGVRTAQPGAVARETGTSPMVAQRATFSIFVRGMRVGSEELSVERTDTEWVLSGSARLEMPLNLTLRQAEVRYALDLTPHRLTLLGQFRNVPVDLTTTIEGTTARNSYLEEGNRTETTVEVSGDAVVLHSNYFGAYAALGARLARAEAGAEIPVYFAPQGEIPAVLNAVSTERVQTAARSFAIRRHRVTFQNPGNPLDVEIETEEDGKLVRVTMPGVDLIVARDDVASVAARRQLFSREGDEDARIPANGFVLATTLSRPRVESPTPPVKRPPRLPAVVLVPGSGEVDRDHAVAGMPMFGQLAAGLADAGYLVARYDKRGVGQSGGRAESATLFDYAADAIAVVKWLADRKDVNRDDITLVGYDEGGWVALAAASREKRIARVALVATPGTTGSEWVLERQQAALAGLTMSDEEKQRRIDLQTRINAAVLGSGSWEGVPDELRAQADSPLFASLLAFDPAKIMSKVRQPVLVLAAELDTQVPAHHAQKLAEIARGRKKDSGTTLETVAGANHLLVPAKTGTTVEYTTLPNPSVSPAVARTIAAWIAGK